MKKLLFLLLYIPLSVQAQDSKVTFTPGLSYEYSFFDQVFSPWNTMIAHVNIETGRSEFIPRIYYSSRFDMTGSQVEVEAYHTFRNNHYVMGIVSFSPDDIFPEHKVIGEYYLPAGSGWVVSGGARYLKFNDPVYMAGASAAKYWRRNITTLKPTLIFTELSNSLNISLRHRWYYRETSFLNLDTFYGYNTDQNLVSQNFSDDNQSRTFGIGGSVNHILSNDWIITAGYSIQHWEEGAQLFNYQHQLQIGISKKL